MTNISITNAMAGSNEPIPVDARPSRYAISTNLLYAIDHKTTHQGGLVVINYEPTRWNEWMPFFSTTNDIYAFRAERYGDLLSEFDKVVKCPLESRLTKAASEFDALYACGGIEIEPAPIIEPEYWLKYSKTQSAWTVYRIEFFCINRIQKPRQLTDANVEYALISLEHQDLDQLLAVGVLNDVPVVDNTLALLSRTEIVEVLRSKAFKV
ncbi:MAG: hypothetical protein ABFD54_12940 [Armatimonadota bacterium]|nr:hypothetical protein [bacterium]